MKSTFLEQLASHILNKHADQLEDVVLVLPSRRARIFLIEAFKKQLKKASWLPQILSMEDFIASISELSSADQLDLIFEFYKVYKEIEGDEADPLEDFMAWANLLIYDFNEVDRNLINAKELFSYLNASKALELWNPGGEELTDFQEKYLRFWEKFNHYYEAFKSHLEKKGIAYQGMLYRKAVSIVEEKGDQLFPQNIYCFAGFNALTPAERKLIELIKEHREVEMLWDADRYYLEDDKQESGIFLRREAESAQQFNWVNDDLMTSAKEINVYGIPGNIGQAKLLAELLDQEEVTDATGSALEKAIILADEALLLPVLESLPEKAAPLNITMGYPIHQSTFYRFFLNYLKLFRNFKSESAGSFQFYHRDLFPFLEDPLLQLLSVDLAKVSQALRAKHQLYFSSKEIAESMPDHLTYLFRSEKLDLIKNLVRIIEQLKASNKLSDLELELLYHFFKLFNRLKEIQKEVPLTAQSLTTLYQQQISQTQLSFVGEPLDGLQIMGVLESRTLDFKELYILSMNEGILPAGKSQNSLIPHRIKKHFGLPTHKEKDAVFAYHFYRLLQRAEKVNLLYNSRLADIKSGERSRFIEQLLHELPTKNPHAQLKVFSVENKFKITERKPLQIEKSEVILQAIKEKLKDGLSPSALNSYLSCPLDFYYNYILGLQEEEQVDPEEGIEDSLFGTLLHDALEWLYKDHEGEILETIDIERISKKTKEALDFSFEKNKIIDWQKGKMKLVYEVCADYLRNFFQLEKERTKIAPIHLVNVERKYLWQGSIKDSSGKAIDISLKGKVDRLEEHAGILRVIDYKSGNVKASELNATSIEEIIESRENKYGKQLQLMMYKFLYEKESEKKNVEAGIISFRNLNAGILEMKAPEELTALELIERIVHELLDSSTSFQHQEKAVFCKFCGDL